MKLLFTILTLIMTMNLMAQDGKASTTKKTFSRETSVSITIKSDPAIIWALLTNGSDLTRWNSTITYFEGDIKVGEKVKLKSYLDDKRVFKIKVKEMDPEKRMVWGDGQGTRVYTITQNDNGTCTFHMTEKIGGLMFPMYAKHIPPFDESFEKYAADLKAEAELIFNSQN